jgi:hypothetical protein
MMISVRQLHAHFVGEASGIDLAAIPSTATLDALKAAIDRYAVLILHDQSLDDRRDRWSVAATDKFRHGARSRGTPGAALVKQTPSWHPARGPGACGERR